MSPPDKSPPLALSLLLAAERFDRTLRERLVAAGWPRLSSNQSRVIAEIDGRRSQAELARRLGITRQSLHVIVGQLRDLDLLEPPGDAVRLSTEGRRMARAAGRELERLEVELEEAWSGGSVAALRGALADWLSLA